MEPTRFLVKNMVQEIKQELAGIYPEREIRQLIHILFEELMEWPATRIHLFPEAEIPEVTTGLFIKALRELVEGKPIQYILGKAWFNGSLLKVDASVLVPRPETEELCSLIKADLHFRRDLGVSILDIGTGSGCIAIDLAKHFPHAEVSAVDASGRALEIARENAMLNHCEITFVQADIFQAAEWVGLGHYHLIVSNPPYVMESEKKLMRRNVLDHEPEQALFVTDRDPLVFYKAISAFSASHLIPPARIYFEINEQFGEEVGQVVASFGFKDIRISKDYHGRNRFVSATLGLPLRDF